MVFLRVSEVCGGAGDEFWWAGVGGMRDAGGGIAGCGASGRRKWCEHP